MTICQHQTQMTIYRITLYDEFLSRVVAEMVAQFINSPAHKLAIRLLYLLIKECKSLSHDIIVPSELEEAVKFFSTDLPNPQLSTVTGSESGNQH